MTTDPSALAVFVSQGYCRRWSVELAFLTANCTSACTIRRCEASGVWSGAPDGVVPGVAGDPVVSVQGYPGSHVERDGPWYTTKVTPTFTDMLGALRLQMWEHEIFGESDEKVPSPECMKRLLHTLSAVA